MSIVIVTIDDVKYTNPIQLQQRLINWYRNDDMFVVNIDGLIYGIDAGYKYLSGILKSLR